MAHQRTRDATRYHKTYSFYRQEPRVETTLVAGPPVPPPVVLPTSESGSVVFVALPTSYDTIAVNTWFNDTAYPVDLNEVYLSALRNANGGPTSGDFWTVGSSLLSDLLVPVHSRSCQDFVLSFVPTLVAPVTVPAGDCLMLLRRSTGSPTSPSQLPIAGWARVPDGYRVALCNDDPNAEYGTLLVDNVSGTSPVDVSGVYFAPQREASGSTSDYHVLSLTLATSGSAPVVVASVTSQTASLGALAPISFGSTSVPTGSALLGLRKTIGSPLLSVLPFWVQFRLTSSL